ncbi:MAG: potassium channel protein [Candidatus Omnitrophota bacterium]|nr:potassium channel protein [Candidatus Omnitrophota bacterium]MBU2528876.1 potassium channel protein [bacterium]MBU3930013.1 potassium channel protein [bacterium]MBU4123354.1 potassium channel protein [bacterium]
MNRKIATIIFLVLFVIAAGTFGYMLIEKWNLMDSLYMTSITLSSIGFGEVHPLSPAGKIFTMVLILFGFSLVAGLAGLFTSLILQGEVGNVLRRQKMKETIKNMKGHHIICGLSPVGEAIVGEFYQARQHFVVIEKDEKNLERIKKTLPDLRYIIGDASQDDVLIEAGVEKAKTVLSCLSSDAMNMYVVISAKSLNPRIKVVAEAVEEEAEAKLKRAGADAVVSPQKIGGLRMASTALRPNVVTFLDIMLKENEGEWRIEEMSIPDKSPFLNYTLAKSQISKNTGLVVIAIKKALTGRFIYNPDAATLLEANDKILVLGNPDKMERLDRYISQGK